jgi:hypothetical protein
MSLINLKKCNQLLIASAVQSELILGCAASNQFASMQQVELPRTIHMKNLKTSHELVAENRAVIKVELYLKSFVESFFRIHARKMHFFSVGSHCLNDL